MSKVTAKKKWQPSAGNCEHLTKRSHLLELHLSSADSLLLIFLIFFLFFANSLLERSKQEATCLSFTGFPVKALGLQSPGTQKVRVWGGLKGGLFAHFRGLLEDVLHKNNRVNQ